MVRPSASVVPGSKPAAKARRTVSTSPAWALELRRIAAVDMRLELAPAGEAVFARQRELDGGEPGLRVLPAQRFQSLLGLVLEMLEAWARGQRSGATRRRTRIVCHGIPSFHMRPVSADLGQEVRSCSNVARRRAEPFTRTVGRRCGRNKDSQYAIRCASPRAGSWRWQYVAFGSFLH